MKKMEIKMINSLKILVFLGFVAPLNYLYAVAVPVVGNTSIEDKLNKDFSDEELYARARINDIEFQKIIVLNEVVEQAENHFDKNKSLFGTYKETDFRGKVYTEKKYTRDEYIEKKYLEAEQALDGLPFGESPLVSAGQMILSAYGPTGAMAAAGLELLPDRLSGRPTSLNSNQIIEKGKKALKSIQMDKGPLAERARLKLGLTDPEAIKNDPAVQISRTLIESARTRNAIDMNRFDLDQKLKDLSNKVTELKKGSDQTKTNVSKVVDARQKAIGKTPESAEWQDFLKKQEEKQAAHERQVKKYNEYKKMVNEVNATAGALSSISQLTGNEYLSTDIQNGMSLFNQFEGLYRPGADPSIMQYTNVYLAAAVFAKGLLDGQKKQKPNPMFKMLKSLLKQMNQMRQEMKAQFQNVNRKLDHLFTFNELNFNKLTQNIAELNDQINTLNDIINSEFRRTQQLVNQSTSDIMTSDFSRCYPVNKTSLTNSDFNFCLNKFDDYYNIKSASSALSHYKPLDFFGTQTILNNGTLIRPMPYQNSYQFYLKDIAARYGLNQFAFDYIIRPSDSRYSRLESSFKLSRPDIWRKGVYNLTNFIVASDNNYHRIHPEVYDNYIEAGEGLQNFFLGLTQNSNNEFSYAYLNIKTENLINKLIKNYSMLWSETVVLANEKARTHAYLQIGYNNLHQAKKDLFTPWTGSGLSKKIKQTLRYRNNTNYRTTNSVVKWCDNKHNVKISGFERSYTADYKTEYYPSKPGELRRFERLFAQSINRYKLSLFHKNIYPHKLNYTTIIPHYLVNAEKLGILNLDYCLKKVDFPSMNVPRQKIRGAHKLRDIKYKFSIELRALYNNRVIPIRYINVEGVRRLFVANRMFKEREVNNFMKGFVNIIWHGYAQPGRKWGTINVHPATIFNDIEQFPLSPAEKKFSSEIYSKINEQFQSKREALYTRLDKSHAGYKSLREARLQYDILLDFLMQNSFKYTVDEEGYSKLQSVIHSLPTMKDIFYRAALYNDSQDQFNSYIQQSFGQLISKFKVIYNKHAIKNAKGNQEIEQLINTLWSLKNKTLNSH